MTERKVSPMQRATQWAVNDLLAEVLKTPRDRENPMVIVSDDTAVTIALPWGGAEPGCFTIRFEATLNASGEPRLVVETSDEAPAHLRRRGFEVL